MATASVVTGDGVTVEFRDAVLCDAKYLHSAPCRHHNLRLSDLDAIRATGAVPPTIVVFVCNCMRCNHAPPDLHAIAAAYAGDARSRAESARLR